MPEWLNGVASKANGRKRHEGSNPAPTSKLYLQQYALCDILFSNSERTALFFENQHIAFFAKGVMLKL